MSVAQLGWEQISPGVVGVSAMLERDPSLIRFTAKASLWAPLRVSARIPPGLHRVSKGAAVIVCLRIDVASLSSSSFLSLRSDAPQTQRASALARHAVRREERRIPPCRKIYRKSHDTRGNNCTGAESAHRPRLHELQGP